MESQTKFLSLHSVPIYRMEFCAIASAVSEKFINHLKNNEILINNSKDILEYYCKEWNVCHKTIQIRDDFQYKDNEILLEKPLNKPNNRFDNMFNQLKLLGRGGFGVVYKVQNISDEKLYAIKKISTESKLV